MARRPKRVSSWRKAGRLLRRLGAFGALLACVAAVCTSPRTNHAEQDPDSSVATDPDRRRLECGDLSTHDRLRGQRSAKGERLERDHVPSNGALRKRADTLLFGRPLTSREEKQLGPAYQRFEKAIYREGYTIAIPADAHRDLSPTHGQGFPQMLADARSPALGARRDVQAIRAGLEKINPRVGRPYASARCIQAYEVAARKILALTDRDYDARLQAIIARIPPADRDEMRRRFLEIDE